MASERIDEIPELTSHAAALGALGYQSKEDFLGVARSAGAALSRYLGTDASALFAQLAPAGWQTEIGVAPAAPRPLGVVLDMIPEMQFAFGLPAGAFTPQVALPAAVDLFPQLPPPLDQGQRMTCVAFASLAVVEHQGMRANSYQQMSEQHMYWYCKQHDGIPAVAGTYLAVAFQLLQSAGCCRETTWSYNPSVIPGNESQGPPPTPAQAEGLAHKVAAYQPLPPTSVPDIKRVLAGGQCVAFSIPVFSWYVNPVVEATGDIINPLPGETVVGGHAMTMIGYRDSPDPGLGGGRFVIRNSWFSWGNGSTHGAGYGTIPYSYVDRFGKEAYSL